MSRLPLQTWRCRVNALLDDPVGQAVLRRDRLTHEDVFIAVEPVARWLRERAAGAVIERRDAA